MERIKGYLEYKLDLELCGVNTFERDDKIRERYEQYLKEISVRKHSKDKQQDIKTNSKKDNNKKRQYNLCKNTLEYKERKETMTKQEEIQQQINNIESKYPNLHIDLHRDQFKSGDVDELEKLYCQLEEVKKYGDVNQGLGSWNGYEYVPNNNQKGRK